MLPKRTTRTCLEASGSLVLGREGFGEVGFELGSGKMVMRSSGAVQGSLAAGVSEEAWSGNERLLHAAAESVR